MILPLAILFCPMMIFILISLSLCSIYNTSNILDVLNYQADLFIFDVDGVLIEPIQQLGNDPWAYWECDKHIDAYDGDRHKGLTSFMDVWVKVRKKIKAKIVDPNIFYVLDELKNIMGFTKRGIVLVDRTIEQFESLNITLNKNPYYHSDIERDEYHYRENILFTGFFLSKGYVFDRFLDHIDQEPRSIVFIDDNYKNLASMREMSKKRGIEFAGIYYDTNVLFDERITNIQLHYLYVYDRILSDKEANDVLSILTMINHHYHSVLE